MEEMVQHLPERGLRPEGVKQVREAGLVKFLGPRSARSAVGFQVNVWNDLSWELSGQSP